MLSCSPAEILQESASSLGGSEACDDGTHSMLPDGRSNTCSVDCGYTCLSKDAKVLSGKVVSNYLNQLHHMGKRRWVSALQNPTGRAKFFFTCLEHYISS